MPYVTSVERIGIKKGLLAGIELMLKMKFGADGLRLLPEIQQIQDLAVIEAVHAAIKDAQTPDEIRRVYAGEG